MPTPLPRLLRRRDAIALVAHYGICEAEFDKLVAAELIERITIKQNGRGYYLTASIQKSVIDRVEAAEAKVTAS